MKNINGVKCLTFNSRNLLSREKNKNLNIRREPRIPSLSATRKGGQISGAVLQIPKPLKSELFFAFPPKIQSFIPPSAGRTSPDSGEGSRVSFLPRPRRLCKLLLRLASASARGCWGRGGVAVRCFVFSWSVLVRAL